MDALLALLGASVAGVLSILFTRLVVRYSRISLAGAMAVLLALSFRGGLTLMRIIQTGPMVLLSGAFGALASIVGTLVSVLAGDVPTGPVIVLALTAIVAVSLLFAPRRGIVAQACWLGSAPNSPPSIPRWPSSRASPCGRCTTAPCCRWWWRWSASARRTSWTRRRRG